MLKDFRTDLTLERKKIALNSDIDGLDFSEFELKGARVTRIEITKDEAAELLNKPKGKYITCEVEPFSLNPLLKTSKSDAVSVLLQEFLPKEGCVLVVGLGNESITPDALGPLTVKKIFVTKHLPERLKARLGMTRLREVAAMAVGVAGQTGLEASSIVRAVCRELKPSAVITVDALAARELSRLGCTVQITDTGISPGSGVGNARSELNQGSIGTKIISIGIPTVADALTAAAGITDRERAEIEDTANSAFASLTVTPKEIDSIVARAASMTALAINCALQPSLSEMDIIELTQ